jgi:hypothetical protein
VTDVFVFLASDESKEVSGKRLQAQEDWKAVCLPVDVVAAVSAAGGG